VSFIMPLLITEKSRVLVELPVAILVRIADGDGKMTAREMECFDKLLAERDWCRSNLLRRALVQTESEKAELWARYTAGELKTEIEHVAAALDTVLSGIAADEREAIVLDLATLARQLLRAANGPIKFLNGDADAAREYCAFMELLKRPSARGRPEAGRAEVRVMSGDTPAHHGRAVRDLALLLTTNFAVERIWQPGKLPVRCIQVSDETHDIKTFQFCADPPKLLVFRPGQFMTLEVPIDGKTVRRSYTISSSPSRPHTFSITVKRVDGGIVSNWLHANMRVGDTLFVDGPHGRFSCLDDTATAFLFLSGGSGVTPLMSMARWLCDTAQPIDVRFLHFARSPADLVFERELQLLARRGNFQFDFVCTRADAASSWTGPRGRIEAKLLMKLCPDLHQRSVYLCGPVPFMETTRSILENLDFDMARVRQESFGGVARSPELLKGQANVPAKVTFAASRKDVPCRGSDYVLDLALASGVQVAFSCRAGQCGTCKVVLLEGQVEQDCADALSPDELKEGFILSCQSRPKGDIVINL
jgi:glycine betaine monooxygenase B